MLENLMDRYLMTPIFTHYKNKVALKHLCISQVLPHPLELQRMLGNPFQVKWTTCICHPIPEAKSCPPWSKDCRALFCGWGSRSLLDGWGSIHNGTPEKGQQRSLHQRFECTRARTPVDGSSAELHTWWRRPELMDPGIRFLIPCCSSRDAWC